MNITEMAIKQRPGSDSGTSAKIIAYKNNKILLLQNPSNTWELPGGHIKKTESREEGARREFKEETGLTAGVLTRLSTQINRVIYKTNLTSINIKLSPEHKKFMFVAVNNLYKMNLSKKAYKDLLFLKPRPKKKDDDIQDIL